MHIPTEGQDWLNEKYYGLSALEEASIRSAKDKRRQEDVTKEVVILMGYRTLKRTFWAWKNAHVVFDANISRGCSDANLDAVPSVKPTQGLGERADKSWDDQSGGGQNVFVDDQVPMGTRYGVQAGQSNVDSDSHHGSLFKLLLEIQSSMEKCQRGVEDCSHDVRVLSARFSDWEMKERGREEGRGGETLTRCFSHDTNTPGRLSVVALDVADGDCGGNGSGGGGDDDDVVQGSLLRNPNVGRTGSDKSVQKRSTSFSSEMVQQQQQKYFGQEQQGGKEMAVSPLSPFKIASHSEQRHENDRRRDSDAIRPSSAYLSEGKSRERKHGQNMYSSAKSTTSTPRHDDVRVSASLGMLAQRGFTVQKLDFCDLRARLSGGNVPQKVQEHSEKMRRVVSLPSV